MSMNISADVITAHVLTDKRVIAGARCVHSSGVKSISRSRATITLQSLSEPETPTSHKSHQQVPLITGDHNYVEFRGERICDA